MAQTFKNPMDMAELIAKPQTDYVPVTRANGGWSNKLTGEGYNLKEPYEDYNDYYGGNDKITRSEREFNLAVGNDYPVYDLFYKNRQNYRDRFRSGEDYQNILKELQKVGTWSKNDYDPRNIRKEYFQRMLDDEEE